MKQMSESFALPSSEATIQRVATRLRERNIDVVIVDDGGEARAAILERLPHGAEVHSAQSKTLQETGIFAAIHDPNRYKPLRACYLSMDRQKQARELRKLVATPDYMVGSVNAVTTDGLMVAASASGSQLGPYASTAGKVLLVVGSQKIVPDLETALQRIRNYALPDEDARIRSAGGRSAVSGSFVGKMLIVEREWIEGRTTVVFVRQPIGMWSKLVRERPGSRFERVRFACRTRA